MAYKVIVRQFPKREYKVVNAASIQEAEDKTGGLVIAIQGLQ